MSKFSRTHSNNTFHRSSNRGILYWARKTNELDKQIEIIETSKNEEISILMEKIKEAKEGYQEQISTKNEDILKVKMRLDKENRKHEELTKNLDKAKQDSLEKEEETRRLRKTLLELKVNIAQKRAQQNLENELLKKKISQLESQMKVERKEDGCQTVSVPAKKEARNPTSIAENRKRPAEESDSGKKKRVVKKH